MIEEYEAFRADIEQKKQPPRVPTSGKSVRKEKRKPAA
jgi:hypothetical protein